jgi:hypothetical protein
MGCPWASIIPHKPFTCGAYNLFFPNDDRALRDIIQQRISHLEFLERNARRQAEAVEQNVARFVEATASLNRGATERRGTEQGSASGSTIPQVSEGFIDRIIALTRASVYAIQNQAFIVERTKPNSILIVKRVNTAANRTAGRSC